MKNYPLERRIDLYRIRRYTDIKRVFQKLAIVYGDNVDVIEYERPKIVFARVGATSTRRLKEVKKRTRASHIRARTKLRRLVEANIGKYGNYKPIFATLTQKENIKSLVTSNRRFTAFIKRCNYMIGHSLKYVVVPEYQERGAVHYHVVFFNLPFVDVHDFEKSWGHGMTNIQVMKKPNRTASYLAKYFSKSFGSAQNFNKKSYFCSRGLIRPIPIYGGFDVDNFLEKHTIKEDYSFNSGNTTIKKYKICKPK